jgi:NADP-dependent 3-hydroxy acid dehydrogenase YdfG
MDVKDKVAVVTGGAQGIRRGLCTRFAREGGHVVGREQDVEHLVEATVEHFGRIDLEKAGTR